MLERPLLNGKVNFPLCLAPMVGLSHVALRAVVREYTPVGAYTLWPTEMLNSRKLPFETLGETNESKKLVGERGLVPQILGNEEKFIAASLPKLTEWGAEAIDINMGCPVKRALRHNYGVALMGDAGYAAEVVRMTVKHATVPVSVKLRAGLQDNLEYLFDFIRGLESAGAAWITLHPRLAEEKRRGRARWEQIKWVRERLKIPVVGNGDVETADDVLRLLDETGCDAVMAGRALAAKPWLMWQVGERLGWANPPDREGEPPRDGWQEGAEYGRALKRLIYYLREFFSEDFGLRKFNFHLRHTSVWLEFGHALMAKVSGAGSWNEVEIVVDDFFTQPHKMMSHTELRM